MWSRSGADSKGGSAEGVGGSAQIPGEMGTLRRQEITRVSCHRNQEWSDFLSNAELLRMRLGMSAERQRRRRSVPGALPEAPSGERWGRSQIRR